MIKTLLTILFFAGTAQAGVPFWQPPQASTRTAYGTGYLAGILDVYPSTSTAAAAPSIMLDGVNRQLTVRNGVNVTTMSATGFYGNGSGLTNAANAAYAAALSTAIYQNGIATVSSLTVNGGMWANGSINISSGSAVGGTDTHQILMGFKNLQQYRHAIHTEHNGSGAAGNLIKFYTWTPADGVGGIGSVLNMTMDNGHVSTPNSLTVASMTVTGNAFSVGGSTLVVSGGKVGVGTASPSSALEVVGKITNSGVLSGIDIYAGHYNPSDGNMALTIGGDLGNYGRSSTSRKSAVINTPSYTLSGHPTLMLWQDNNTTTSDLLIGGGNGYQYASTHIGLFTAANNTTDAGTERLTILSGGNVGIGTTAPTHTLQVNGGIAGTYINASSSITVAGNYYGSGASLSEVSNLVSSGTVSVATGTINITGLDGNADGEYRLVFFSSTTDSGASFSLYFNGDVTATNYYRTVNGAAATNNSVFMFTTSMGSPNQLLARIDISRGADGHVLYSSQGLKTNSSDIVSLDVKGHHVSAQTNITSIHITGPNNVMLVGTTWELYRSR